MGLRLKPSQRVEIRLEVSPASIGIDGIVHGKVHPVTAVWRCQEAGQKKDPTVKYAQSAARAAVQ